MSKRITIMLDDDLHDKLCTFQANIIKKTHKAYSFSRCINDKLRGKLK